MITRPALATLGLIAAVIGWYFNFLPRWLAALTAISLVIGGLNLDWRRKEREANVRASTEERRRRRREQEASETEKRSEERQ